MLPNFKYNLLFALQCLITTGTDDMVYFLGQMKCCIYLVAFDIQTTCAQMASVQKLQIKQWIWDFWTSKIKCSCHNETSKMDLNVYGNYLALKWGIIIIYDSTTINKSTQSNMECTNFIRFVFATYVRVPISDKLSEYHK